MRHRFNLLSLAVVLLSACGLLHPANAQPPPLFTTSGGRLLKSGSEFVVHGISVPGPGVGQSRAITKDVDLIASVWKFNLVRVECVIKPRTPVKEANDLDSIVQAFTSRGIVVLIDPRDHFGGYYSDPPSPPGSASLSDLIDWYKDVCERYRSNPYVWFTVMSGPGVRDDRRSMEPWQEVHSFVLQAIRKRYDAPNIVVCEGRYHGIDSPPNGALPVSDSGSAVLSFGPDLATRYPNLLFGFHMDEDWNAGVPKLQDYLDRVRTAGLAVFVSEYGSSGWTDSTPAIEAMFAVCKAKHIGRCAWSWLPADNQRLCAPDEKQAGWQIDTTDGSKPTNLSWLGDRVWDDNHSLTPLHGALLDRAAWTATAFPKTQSAGYNEPDNVLAAYTLQDDYWTTNKAQEPGQWFALDMGARHTFTRLMVDTRARFADYPRGYELYVSNDGVVWGAPIAKGKNDQSVLRLSFPPQTARYIKIVQTGKTWHHWVVANVEVYAPIGASNALRTDRADTSAAPIEPRAWSASAGPNRWYDVEVPIRRRFDDNRSTGAGLPQRPGQYFQVDMAEPQRFNRIVLNSGRATRDYPRGYEVQVSANGEEWSKPIAVGRGMPITTVSFPTQTARYVRFTLNRSTRNYWNLAEFRVYLDPGADVAGGRK